LWVSSAHNRYGRWREESTANRRRNLTRDECQFMGEDRQNIRRLSWRVIEYTGVEKCGQVTRIWSRKVFSTVGTLFTITYLFQKKNQLKTNFQFKVRQCTYNFK
jgi:hypothetical protein